MVTGIDLVRSQILLADGNRLHDAPVNTPPQDKIEVRGVAMQCRITTEDPERFIPDYGRITTYRSAGGFGVRLDGGNGFRRLGHHAVLRFAARQGHHLGHDTRGGGARNRALREFRIRGVKTNISFLLNLIDASDVQSRPGDDDVHRRHAGAIPLRARARSRDEGARVPRRRHRQRPGGREGATTREVSWRRAPVPPSDAHRRRRRRHAAAAAGARTARDSRSGCGAQKRLLITDTTMRDAHQSLLATRVRTYDMLAIADSVARRLPESVQPGDVGRRDVRHVDAVSAGGSVGASPRAAAAGAQHPVPDAAARAQRGRLHHLSGQRGPRVHRAKRARRHRSVPHLRFAELDGEHAGGDRGRARDRALCEAAICYTGDILDPRDRRTGCDTT